MTFHVGMFANYFSLVRGGAEMYVADLSERLERLGCRVTVVAGRSLLRAPAPARPDAEVLYSPCLFELREVARRLPPRLDWLLSSSTEAFYTAFARRHMERFDVVHCHGYDTARAALETRRRGPVLLTMHGPPSAKPRVGRLLRRLDALVSPSESIRDQVLKDHGVEARLIPMGVDLDRFAPCDRDAVRWRLGWEGRKVVFFAGRLIVQKDVPTLLRAFALVAREDPSARLVVAGGGVLAGALSGLAAGLGIADRVEFAGTLSRPDLALRYGAADVQVLPSLYENFPMVAMEAIACGARMVVSDGVPAITSRFPQVASFPAGDHVALSARLRDGLEGRIDPVPRAALEPYSWSRIGQAYLDLYAGLVVRSAA